MVANANREPDFLELLKASIGGGAAGAFSNAIEGSTVTLSGLSFQITYLANWVGCDGASSFTVGNDVALFAVPEPNTFISRANIPGEIRTIVLPLIPAA